MTIDTKAIREEAAHGFVVRPTVLALLDAYEAALKEAEARGLEKAAQWHDEQAAAAQRFADAEAKRAAQMSRSPIEAFLGVPQLANHHKECAAALRQRAKEQDNG